MGLEERRLDCYVVQSLHTDEYRFIRVTILTPQVAIFIVRDVKCI